MTPRAMAITGIQYCCKPDVAAPKARTIGSIKEVRQEVRRVMQILGPRGGCMIGAVHTVMDDVPPENVLAMVDAVEEFGHYPLQ